MRPVKWLLLSLAALPGRALAVETCASASAKYVSAVILAARNCLVRQLPQGRSCTPNNRIPNLRAQRVQSFCPSDTVARLACTARQALLPTGLPYSSLIGSGFTHVCTTAACGNGVLEPGEQCDDGNTTGGDNCSPTCQIEGGACNDVCAGVVPVPGTAIRAERIASGLSRPLLLTAPPRDVSRLFIVEKTGRIRILKWGALLPTPFLDISALVSSGSEQGLLGLAFHPQYADNGRFFINYTDTAGNTVVAEYRVSSNPDIADPTPVQVILQVSQPYANHNGGHLAFGPDGYLYIGLGDGGSAGDPQGNGQNPATLLGKMLRIDVDHAAPYAVPPTNPFVGAGPPLDEIWALGLRNPWRYSFDRITGDLYIADVGQNRFEEINFQPASSPGGENYGWNIVEGNAHCFPSGSTCDQTGLTQPIHEYDHSQGCSVTGGYVYRGCKMPDLRGRYFYADFCTAFVRSFRVVSGVATDHQDHTAELESSGVSIDQVASFGEDARGELYIADLGGEVFKIVPATP
ncbi:MAG: PQQ-dependent sugar dehydrogenase [Candidatus Binatia bacterium]|nr:PQQ-dependent sugar dehydrogenase [Candidatus Binatia bacterium]